jgi:uncharacterized phage protein (TIGR01671 family)
MNRQLKFRCWDKVNKNFVPPSHIAINGNGILLITDSGMYEKFQNKNYCDVDQEYVIQQFTGEYDKNKKEIYEGDIIRSYSEEFINENYEGEVVFVDAAFNVKIDDKTYAGLWSGDDIEVLGHKFELPCNPDHNGECLVCDEWLSDCPFLKFKE